MKITPIKPVVGYCRFSSNNQADGFSIEAQKRAIKEFCDREGYTVLKYYVDEAKSGTTTKGRNAFNRMMDEADNGDFIAIVVHKLDRFARNRYDSIIYRKALKDRGIQVISVLERIDDSPESVMLESTIEAVNEYYSLNLARETRKGQRIAGEQGRILGTIPLGYDSSEDKHFLINEKEAEAVRYIFTEFTSGTKMSTIARELNAQGFKTKKGNSFKIDSIRAIVKNELYTGRYRFGELINDKVPPIISEETYLAAQKRVNDRKRITPKDKGSIYLLTGLIYHECQDGSLTPMIGYKTYKKKRPYQYYRCKNCNFTLKKREIEETIVNELTEFFTSDGVVNKVLSEINKEIKNASESEDAKELRSSLNALREQDGKLLDLYLTSVISKELYESKKSLLDTQIKQVEHKLATCTYALKFSPSVLKSAFEYYAYKIKNGLSTDIALQATITAFINKVIVSRQSLRIEYRYKGSGNKEVATKREKPPRFPTLLATYHFINKDSGYKTRLNKITLL